MSHVRLAGIGRLMGWCGEGLFGGEFSFLFEGWIAKQGIS